MIKILSSGIVPIRKYYDDYEFLVLRYFNYWDFPKGEVEEGENPFIAAQRELKEETNIKKISFPWGNSFIETSPYSKGKVARYYLGEINRSENIKLLPNPKDGIVEHHEYRWLPYDQARLLLVPRVQAVLDWANQKIMGSET